MEANDFYNILKEYESQIKASGFIKKTRGVYLLLTGVGGLIRSIIGSVDEIV